MSSQNRYQEAMRAWREAAVPGTDSDVSTNRDARSIDALEDAIRAIPSISLGRQPKYRSFAVLFAAAALVSLVIGVVHFQPLAPHRTASTNPIESTLRAESSTALVIRNGATRFVEPGTSASLQAGDEVSVGTGGQAELKLPSAAIVKIASATRVRVRDLNSDENIDLVRGAVSLSVPKLQPPHALSVFTPDARVAVHGTRFRVTVVDGVPSVTTETSVAVTEGEVAVVVPTGHIILRTGQNWRSSEPTSISPASPASPTVQGNPQASASTDRATRSTPKPIAGTSVPSQPAESQTTMEALAEQNRLYRAALAARHVGDEKGAVTLLSELLDRFPQSPASSGSSQRTRAGVVSVSA